MKIKLTKKWIEYLCSMRESGMGYQIVDATLKDGRVLKKIVVFNAEELELPSEYKDIRIDDIKNIKLSENNKEKY
jgi:hypothetical protein